MPIRVKLLTKNPSPDISPGWRRYIPGGSTRVGDCEFLLKRDERDYDWLAVYDDLPPLPNGGFSHWAELLPCPRERTLLITSEPSAVKTYGRGFLRQFGHLLTSQEPWAVPHPSVVYRQPGLIRFYEGEHEEIAAAPVPEKTALFSTVCSSKQQRHTLHHARYTFTQRLKTAIPELEIFGHGVRPIARKRDVLDPYRYHLAIENHVSPHHWTEKLADAFLGHCLCFYHGAPNAADYFPPESFIPINIHRFDEAAATIREAIARDEFSRRLPAITESRRLVLERWGTFPNLADVIASLHPGTSAARTMPDARILSRHAWRAAHPLGTLSLLGEKAMARARLAWRRH
jgi:hypothetical protein